MSAEPSQADAASLPLQVTRQIDELCDEFEGALRQGGGVAFEQYLGRVEMPWRELLVKELAVLALGQLREAGSSDPIRDLVEANPGLREDLIDVTHDSDGPPTIHMNGGSSSSNKASGLVIRCPHCHSTIELVVDASLVDIGCSNCGGSFSLVNDGSNTRDATTFSRVAHFELIERLGMGEFGTVWKARDTLLDRTVALKIPRREQLDAVSIEKFMREARAAAQLRHPNIISTHEVGRHADTLYIVTDYIRGASLADVISDHRLGVRESVVIASKVADALEHAHRSGVIHRDLKPSNILVDDRGEPHLMDFGLAKRKEMEVTITTDGAILGTPAYMSPEQARGEAARVDGRTDVYSLGVLLFQLLTGELPFRGSMRILLQKVINDDPPGPRSLDGRVPKDLDTICLKCMEKDPARRYATAGDLAADLRRFSAGEPVVARRIGRWGRTMRWARRNPAISLLLAGILVTLLTATVVSSYFAWRASVNLARADAVRYESLLQEMRLTGEVRRQGYGETVRGLVNEALALPTPRVKKDELRRQLVLSMGDFVAYPPTEIIPSEGSPRAFRLSKDGREIFVGLDNGKVLAYEVGTGQVHAELDGLTTHILSIAVSSDGNRLVAADQNGMMQSWRRAGQNWELEASINLGEAPRWVHLSHNGERAAWLKDNLLEIWDTRTGTKLHSLKTEDEWSLRNAAFDTSRHRVAAGYANDRTDRVGWALWDLDTGKRLHEIEMHSLGNTFGNGIGFAEASDRLAIGFDQALLVYELMDLQRSRLSGFDSTKAVAFSPTAPYLAAVNIRGRITIWNADNSRQIAMLHHPAKTTSLNGLAFSADGGSLAASNADSVQIWDLKKAGEKTVMSGHRGAIPCSAFHPNGRLLATGGMDNHVRFWNPFTGQFVRAIDLDEAVQALEFSPDGQVLAAGTVGRVGADHLRLIDVDANKVIYQTKPAMGDVYSLAWAAGSDGSYLAATGDLGAALWKVHLRSPVRLEEFLVRDGAWCLATVLDSRANRMIWVDRERQINAWDIVSRQDVQLHASQMQQGWHGLAMLPDNQSILYISDTGTAQIWNVQKDQPGNSIGEPGTFGAPHIALSPNGKWLAALTQPDTVSIWHRPTGEHVFSMRPETGSVWTLAWDPSSKHLAVGQSDGSLAVWHLSKVQQKLAEAGLEWVDD
jgi:WD40 repeat protein/tRNA A-37 threonylcarbamoyl transferase component Bud32